MSSSTDLAAPDLAAPVVPGTEHPEGSERQGGDELKTVALDLLNQMVGNDLMVGFATELQAALVDVNKVVGTPKSSYRCVKLLASRIKVTEKVLSAMADL